MVKVHFQIPARERVGFGSSQRADGRRETKKRVSEIVLRRAFITREVIV